MNIKKIIYLFCILFLFKTTSAQTNNKYEFRGVWIATIGNIDWPNKNHLDAYGQQQDFINLLNTLQATGINAVIVQVRPVADAFYKSSFEEWSKYVTGFQGQEPNPYYDPLIFMINESHKRGMEFHAWFNPYRALIDCNKNIHPANHPTHTHPEWFVNYGGKKYFNPGIPDVRKYVQDVVCEVVKNYDIDAVHFDDYFYPYKIGKQEFADNNTFAMYNNGIADKGDWRRNNVNIFIEELSKKIKSIKPTVKFGISPFGIWRNIKNDADGSNTTGSQNYDDLYADVILWQKKGWIDYLMPQLYWHRGHKAADFTTLLNWWNNHTYNRAMYIGQGLYQLGVGKDAAWHSVYEIPEQIKLIRENKNISGYSLYSANCFYKNKYGIVQEIQNTINTTKAIVPPMKWLDNTAPLPPSYHILKTNAIENTIQLKHNSIDANCFVVYKFLKSEKIDLSQANHIEAITNEDVYTFKNNYKDVKYVITSLDKIHNESYYKIIE